MYRDLFLGKNKPETKLKGDIMQVRILMVSWWWDMKWPKNYYEESGWVKIKDKKINVRFQFYKYCLESPYDNLSVILYYYWKQIISKE